MERKYIKGLDGLRAIAIMMVFFYHLQLPFAKGGLFGVPIFFVLSGYLITRNLTKEIVDTGSFNFINFWKKRIVRLFPLVLTVSSFAIIMTAIFNRVAFTKGCKDLISSVFFFNNWWQIINDVSYFENAGAPSPLTHFWALAVEVQFYLIFPIVVFILSKFPKKERITLCTVSVFAIASAILMAVMFHPGEDPSRVYYGTDTRIYSFLFGAILSILTGAYKEFKKIPESLPDFVGIPAIIILIVCMCLWDGHSNWLYWGGFVLISLLSAVVIYSCLDNDSILSRVLSCKPLKWLGDRSYSIYLWHYVVIIILTGGVKAKWWMNLIIVLLSFALAILGYRYIETPVRKGAIKRNFEILRLKPRTVKGELIKERTTKRVKIVSIICVVVLLTEILLVAFVPKVDLASVAEERQQQQDEADQIASERLEQQQQQQQEQEEQTTQPAVFNEEELLQNLRILLIGDSITVNVAQYYNETFASGIADSKIGRQAYDGDAVFRTKVEEGWSGDAVIFELGSNGPLKESELDDLREAAGPDIKMFVCTIVVPHNDYWDANNKLIREFAEKTDNTYLIDWDQCSSVHPEYFDQDDTHLLPAGAEAYNEMIKEAVIASYKN